MPVDDDLIRRISELSNLIHERTRATGPSYIPVPASRLRRMRGGAHGEPSEALFGAAAVDDLPEFGFNNVSFRLALD